MKGFGKRFDDLMVASVFAEAGEFEVAKEIFSKKRRVLLVLLKGGISKKGVLYAINVCKRVRAGLDILFISDKEGEPEDLKELMKDLGGEEVNIHIIKKEKGCLKKEILEYVSERKNIDFVVVEATEDIEMGCKERGFMDVWSALSCPLVVVA